MLQQEWSGSYSLAGRYYIAKMSGWVVLGAIVLLGCAIGIAIVRSLYN